MDSRKTPLKWAYILMHFEILPISGPLSVEAYSRVLVTFSNFCSKAQYTTRSYRSGKDIPAPSSSFEW
jgi:hypothetical protein